MNPIVETVPARIACRPVRADDESFLFEVYAGTRVEELAVVDWSEQQRDTFLRMQFQAQDQHYRENYPGAELRIILVDGERAGRLYIYRRAAEIRIMDIALLPAVRGRGIGTVLMQAILSEGAQSGKTVSIHVEAFNPALRWYERLGFKTVSVNGPYHLMQWS